MEFLKETGLQGDPETVNTEYFTALARTGTPYPGAKELLERLSKTCELYMVTNGNVVSQFPRLEHSGLMPYLREVFVSEAVGDSLSSDIQGAVNAGLDSIWYTPASTQGALPQHALPTYQAESYSDILRILGDV